MKHCEESEGAAPMSPGPAIPPAPIAEGNTAIPLCAGVRSAKSWIVSGTLTESGFTLIELLIALVAGFLVLGSIAMFFSGATKSYTRAENFMQLRSNLNATLDRVAEELMQAGADLPKQWPAVQPATGVYNDVTVITNPGAGYHSFAAAVPSATDPVVKVDNANGFLHSPPYTSLLSISAGVNSAVTLKISKSGGGFLAGTGIDTLNDSLALSGTMGFSVGDMLFVADTLRYYQDAPSKTLHVVNKGSDVVYAKNVETFYMKFFDVTMNAKTLWADMRVCSLFVGVCASRPEKGVSGDGFRRASGSRKFYFRNREY